MEWFLFALGVFLILAATWKAEEKSERCEKGGIHDDEYTPSSMISFVRVCRKCSRQRVVVLW